MEFIYSEPGTSAIARTAWPTIPLYRPDDAMNTKIVKLLALSVTLFMTQPAFGESLKISTIQGPPWGFVGSDGKPTGMMYEIGNRIAEVAGLSYTNVLVPYARTALDIENGHADLVLRFGNEHLMRFAIPVSNVVAMPIILIGPSGTAYKNLKELHGKTVGVIRTSKYVEQFDNDTAIHKYAVNDYVVMTKMLASRRMDAGVGSSVGLLYGAYMAGLKAEDLGTPLVLGHNDFILFISKKNANPETIQALKESVKKLTASGEIKTIVAKYSKFITVALPSKQFAYCCDCCSSQSHKALIFVSCKCWRGQTSQNA